MIDIRFKRLLYFILIFFFIVDIACPITNEGKTSVQVPSSLIGGRESPGASAASSSVSSETTPRVPIQSPRGDSDSIPSQQPAPTRITMSSGNESIKVVKVITPRTNKTGRRMGEFAKVCVEIHSIANKPIKISIREIIDENLRIFKSTEHGYILSNEDQVCYYKLGFLDDIESGSLMATPASRDNKSIIFKKGKCNISLCELKISDYAYRNRYILIYPLSKNDSLMNNSYSALREFLEYKLGLNNSRFDNLTINCTQGDNLSIKNGGEDILIIADNMTCTGDRCPVLIWNDIPHYLEFKKINNKKYIYDTLNILAFDDVILKPDSTFVFWYHVMPNNHGIYDTETLVTLKETQNKTISSHLELEILEDNPQFDVHRKFNKNQIHKNDIMDFEFDVDYKGGGAEPVIKNVPVRFNPSNDYEYLRIDGKDINTINKNNSTYKNFIKNNTVPISVTIKFNKTGILSPPSIWVNNRHYLFDGTPENVIVDVPFWRYFNLINLLFLAIVSLVAFLAKDIYLETGGRRNELMKRINDFRGSLFGPLIIYSLALCVLLIIYHLYCWLFKI